MDSTQLGRAGELALSLYGLVTSDGRLELFSPVADDDHVDLVAGLKGGLPVLGIQVKTTDGLDKNGLVEARASYVPGEVRNDPAFLYAILLIESVKIEALWIVPSPDFNRLAYRTATAGRECSTGADANKREDCRIVVLPELLDAVDVADQGTG